MRLLYKLKRDIETPGNVIKAGLVVMDSKGDSEEYFPIDKSNINSYFTRQVLDTKFFEPLESDAELMIVDMQKDFYDVDSASFRLFRKYVYTALCMYNKGMNPREIKSILSDLWLFSLPDKDE